MDLEPNTFSLAIYLRALDGYCVTADYVTRTVKKRKYGTYRRSYSSKNNPEQKTVTVDAATGEETYEPAPPPKPTQVKRLQTQVNNTNQRIEEVTLSYL